MLIRELHDDATVRWIRKGKCPSPNNCRSDDTYGKKKSVGGGTEETGRCTIEITGEEKHTKKEKKSMKYDSIQKDGSV